MAGVENPPLGAGIQPWSNIRQDDCKKTDDKILRAKLSLNWTGPFKKSIVGLATTAPGNRYVGDKLLSLPTCLELMANAAVQLNAANRICTRMVLLTFPNICRLR